MIPLFDPIKNLLQKGLPNLKIKPVSQHSSSTDQPCPYDGKCTAATCQEIGAQLAHLKQNQGQAVRQAAFESFRYLTAHVSKDEQPPQEAGIWIDPDTMPVNWKAYRQLFETSERALMDQREAKLRDIRDTARLVIRWATLKRWANTPNTQLSEKDRGELERLQKQLGGPGAAEQQLCRLDG